MKILLTGFDPFGGEKINPAWEAVRLVRETDKFELVKMQLPTVYYKAPALLESKLAEERPDVTVCVGQAEGRKDITPERVAINVNDARIDDNEGNRPVDEKIRVNGRNAYFSTLPIKEIVSGLKERGIPSSVSNTAGTFVCNHIMYSLLYMAENEFPGMKGGFIHVPCIPEQLSSLPEGTPSMELSEIVRGLETALDIIYERR